MRVFILLFIAPILFCFIACKKTEIKYNDIASSFKAIKNGTNWISTDSWAYFATQEKIFSITGSLRDSKYY